MARNKKNTTEKVNSPKIETEEKSVSDLSGLFDSESLRRAIELNRAELKEARAKLRPLSVRGRRLRAIARDLGLISRGKGRPKKTEE